MQRLPMEFDVSDGEMVMFVSFLHKVVGRDDRYKHLLVPEYKEERTSFYNYFKDGLSPWQSLQKEYQEYGP